MSHTHEQLFVIDNLSLPHKNGQGSSLASIFTLWNSSKSLVSEKNGRGFKNGLSHNYFIAMATLNKQRSRHSRCMKSKRKIS